MKSINTNYEYINAIYKLSKNLKTVRSVDIANLMKVSKPAVSTRMKQLISLEYITMGSKEIRLTEKGKNIAEKLCNNYELFKLFLETMGIEKNNADEIAYHTAQIISQNSITKCSHYLEDVG